MNKKEIRRLRVSEVLVTSCDRRQERALRDWKIRLP